MKGNCLCGVVTIEVANTHELHACHCQMCRKWSGGAGFSLYAQGIVTSDSEHIASYQSSAWGERAFCKTCGTHLYFHQLGTDNYYLYAARLKLPACTTATNRRISSKLMLCIKIPIFLFLQNEVAIL